MICLKKHTIIASIATLFFVVILIPKTAYADVYFSPNCENNGWTNCICAIKKQCPDGSIVNGCVQVYTSNPTAEQMQQVQNMIGNCPDQRAIDLSNQVNKLIQHPTKPTCTYYGPGPFTDSSKTECTTEWTRYINYMKLYSGVQTNDVNFPPTPTPTPTSTIYIPLPTFTPTPSPTVTPTPTIKQMSIQTQKERNHNSNSSLFQNIQKFFGTISGFLKNIVGRR